MRRSWAFPLLVGLALVALEATVFALLATGAPPGMRWLGDTIGSPSDTAVYLSEIGQAAHGSPLLKDLYAIEPHAPRFDPFWSTLGIISRIGLTGTQIYAAAIGLFTFFVVFVLWWLARSMRISERNVRLFLLLSVLGVGGGSFYTIWLTVHHAWTWGTLPAPDVGFEFSLFPALLQSGHLIASFGLLLLALRGIWLACETRKPRPILIAVASSAILLSFHPYFVPLLLIYETLLLIPFRRTLTWKRFFAAIALTLFALIPAAAIYLPLAFDPVFRSHHLIVNRLPLPPPLAWTFTLLPFAVALGWRWSHRIRLTKDEQWILFWFVAAGLCLFLPVPWSRKFVEACGIGLVLLTLPAWAAIRDDLVRGPLRWLMVLILLLVAGLSPLQLLLSQAAWAAGPETRQYLYATHDVFHAWDWIRFHTPSNAVLLTDDLWTNVWTPPETLRTVWMGHDHETPSYAEKRVQWNELLATISTSTAGRILTSATVTDFLTTSVSSTERFQHLLAPSGWSIVATFGQAAIFEQRDMHNEASQP